MCLLSLLFISSISIQAKEVNKDSSFGNNIVNNNITPQEVEAAQRAWGEALVKISTTFDNNGLKKATKVANEVIDSAYGYDTDSVLFKPTLTHGEQTFRTTKEGALAYFVGSNKNFPNDQGFALKGWRGYSFNNVGVYINGNFAITMGKVVLTDKDGKTTSVDKTWGFKKDDKGTLRIILHHSSLPYQPVNKTASN